MWKSEGISSAHGGFPGSITGGYTKNSGISRLRELFSGNFT
jgi:hypothetical protein